MSSAPRVAAVIPAAGSGTRMQSQTPKQFLVVQGKTLLQHSVTALLADARVEHVFVAVNEHNHNTVPKSLAQISFVAGGTTRAESVLSGVLHAITQGYTHVVVHDAARPRLPLKVLSEVIDTALRSDNGAIVAMPMRDSLKLSEPDHDIIAQSLSREQLWLAQTPQVFAAELLADAISEMGVQNTQLTDEASAMEFVGYHPRLVMGSLKNMKVTHPEDLELITLVLGSVE